MVQLNYKVEDANLATKLARKEKEFDAKVKKLQWDILFVAFQIVKEHTPRKTTKLYTAIQHKQWGKVGRVFINTHMAPYANWVIDGTGPHNICASRKKAIFYPGIYGGHPWKCVPHPGARGQPFIDDSIPEVNQEITKKINTFLEWVDS